MADLQTIQQQYTEQIVPNWVKGGSASSPMAVPKITKVVINSGIGNYKANQEAIDEVVEQLKKIAGQQPVVVPAKKAKAGFDLREGEPVGVRVTLRGERMYQFLEKVFNFVLPRTRDFRGLSRESLDGHGNYSFGIQESGVFLEIDPNKIRRNYGLQVSIITNTDDDSEAEKLLRGLGVPLKPTEQGLEE